MNYHHIYHAGNFADIFKHIILCFCLEKFHEKPTPFFVLDTHAGIGKYDLSDEKSLKTFESDEGIKKILATKKFDFLPERFLKILAKTNRCEISQLADKLKFYGGSPMIIADYLRAQDRGIFAELNREDFSQLRKNFAGSQKYSLENIDGLSLLKSKLPPLEKRGLILIDPAFEKIESKVSKDYEKVISALEEAYKRFAHGVYAIWHPIIKNDAQTLGEFYEKIFNLKFEKIMHVTFDVGQKSGEEKMQACGMFIINAPWQLDEKLNAILPNVLKMLKQSDEARFEIKNRERE